MSPKRFRYVPSCQRTEPEPQRPSSQNSRALTIQGASLEQALVSSPARDGRAFAEGPARSFLVGLGGLEPPTSPLSGVRSNHLSYRPDVAAALSSDGGASRDRTDDPLLAKQVLSQLSYGPGIRSKPSLRDDKTAQTQ